MVRPSNQDAFHVQVAPNASAGADALLAVADGMGGHQAGEVASAIAIEGLISGLFGGLQERDAVESIRSGELLRGVVLEVNGKVYAAASSPERRGMGTILTVGLLVGSRLIGAHVEDSRAYLLRNGHLRQITADHTWVAAEMARGTLTEEQARVHPGRNVVTRAIGTAPHVEVDGTAVEVEDGDTLLLCSDGLHSVVEEETIRETLAGDEPQKVSESLVEQANALGGGPTTLPSWWRVLGSSWRSSNFCRRTPTNMPNACLWVSIATICALQFMNVCESGRKRGYGVDRLAQPLYPPHGAVYLGSSR